ncbi:helix-turn-helix domain-containing protein [Micromonospora arborensis]|uniref:helix-turn-helix domain-containing protein n=1 Tax=Micromonospora arborensis TaxID=2116518 RepID=UPI0033D39F56
MVVLASAGGNSVPVIARLVQADGDSVRGVIHRFNEMGMPSLDPNGLTGNRAALLLDVAAGDSGGSRWRVSTLGPWTSSPALRPCPRWCPGEA